MRQKRCGRAGEIDTRADWAGSKKEMLLTLPGRIGGIVPDWDLKGQERKRQIGIYPAPGEG